MDDRSRHLDLTLPPDVAREVAHHIEAGEFTDAGALTLAALRYWLERHREEDWRAYAEEEIAWSKRVAGR